MAKLAHAVMVRCHNGIDCRHGFIGRTKGKHLLSRKLEAGDSDIRDMLCGVQSLRTLCNVFDSKTVVGIIRVVVLVSLSAPERGVDIGTHLQDFSSVWRSGSGAR